MVQDETHIGTLLDQCQDAGELPVTLDAEIETEPGLANELHAAHEIRFRTKRIVGLGLDQLSHTADERHGRKPLELRGYGRALGDGCPGNDAGDARFVGFCKF